MEKIKPLFSCKDTIGMIWREIEGAELHLQHAQEYIDVCSERAGMSVDIAEQNLATADRLSQYNHKHLGSKHQHAPVANGNPQPIDTLHQAAKDLWSHEHPDIHEAIDGVRHRIDSHKKRLATHGSGQHAGHARY